MSETDIKTLKKQQSKRKPTPASWKPGECPNPNGRPRKGSDLAGILREYLDGTVEGDKATRGEVFVKAMYAAALRGGAGAQTKILEYTVGIPVQRHEIEQTTKDMSDEEIEERYREIEERIRNDDRGKKGSGSKVSR